jgi:hypothetical protein
MQDGQFLPVAASTAQQSTAVRKVVRQGRHGEPSLLTSSSERPRQAEAFEANELWRFQSLIRVF